MKKFFVVFLIVALLLGLAAVIDSVYKDAHADANEEDGVVADGSNGVKEPVFVEMRAIETPPASTEKTMYVLGDHVNERETPSTDSAVLNFYCAGETVTIVGKTGDWYQIKDGGYIYQDLLTENYDDIVPHFLETYQDLIVTHISHGQKTEYWYYGECIASGYCVTGDAYASPTPIGLYWITSRQTDVDMYGNPDWHSDWACYFNGLIAYHNAPWRHGSFGGTIYQGGGSHGCINCSDELAEAIFNHCRVGYTYVLILP